MSSSEDEDKKVSLSEVYFEPQFESSSEEPPPEEWSSLIISHYENPKRKLHAEGLYDPGSGEICTKYIAQSASSVFRHVFYRYPPLKDPGIEKVLLKPEEPIIYADDGQDLYLDICEEMKESPVRIFHRNLVEPLIDLKYYGVSLHGIRAMAMALRYNRDVKTWDLTDNFLSQDGCYHIGDMLTKNTCLTELNLSGCRIGPEGLKRIIMGLLVNRTLKKLVLDRNQLGDEGGLLLAKGIFEGIDITQLGLSNNSLGTETATAVADSLETHNKFTHLDLSWNDLRSPNSTYRLLNRLSENENLKELNLSWNSLSGEKIGLVLKKIFINCKSLTHLDLSNNRLFGEAIITPIKVLHRAKNLVTLNLSSNPLTFPDCVKVIDKMKDPGVVLKNLLLDNIVVNGPFLQRYKDVMAMKCRKDTVITWGEEYTKYIATGTDMRLLILRRVDYCVKKQMKKKKKIDIALWLQRQVKDEYDVITYFELMYALKRSQIYLDEKLLDAMVETFLAFRTPKAKYIDLKLVVDYIKRIWPDRKLPPTPPPEPEPEPDPEPEPEPPKKGKKGKKGKK